MVDWHNPQTIAAELFAYVKLLHVVAGLYFWEYFTNLHYEWEFIKRKRPYRWTIWLYSVTRFCALMNIILGLVAFNTQRPLNCELWLLFEFIFAYVAFALAAFLIIIRIVAIWNRDRYVSLLAISIWLVNIAFLLRSTAKADSKWDDGSKGCTIVNSKDSRINVTVTLVSDLLCLFIMIIGLRRQRDHALGRMLFNQGLIWVVLATVSEMPPTIFLWLDLNDAMNIMFQTPSR
ncbi:hypothetical protein FA95DRAFT_50322 [Auriscalpium vulgare]|uniref:Uncharacterized protein n=1 Tax=Auriscalpium vulgare TaxID=40419 RepID=A0ACB8S7I5_9AGAM|nr:hypothetical protein FA95DRAFT_50322 [Auriscalpium vulgare]